MEAPHFTVEVDNNENDHAHGDTVSYDDSNEENRSAKIKKLNSLVSKCNSLKKK